MILNKEVAYLLGVYLGDGSVWDNGCGVKVFGIVASDKDFVEEVARCIGEVVGNIPNIGINYKHNRKHPYYRCQTSKSALPMWLVEQTHHKTIIPQIILDSNDVLKKEFIAGLLDSEGYVSLSKRHMYGGHEVFDMQIGFSVQDPWIFEFRDILIKMGICCNSVGRYTSLHVKSKIMYRFTINKRSFVDSGLYFKIRRKQDRIEHYKSLFPSSTTKRKIPFTEDHKNKISLSRLNEEFTEEHKYNLSKARKKWLETRGEIKRDGRGRFVKR